MPNIDVVWRRRVAAVCASVVAGAIFLAGTVSSAWSVDVPFSIDNGIQVIEGIGRLENGHFTGQASRGVSR
jgi:hypothetical protein